MTTDKKEEISFTEFKAWLQGVEEMQEDDWAPNHIQWKKIKEKLSQVNFPQPHSNIATQRVRTVEQPMYQPAPEFSSQDMQPGFVEPVSRFPPARLPETADPEAFLKRGIPRENQNPHKSSFI